MTNETDHALLAATAESAAKRQLAFEQNAGDLVERGGVVGRDVWVISPRRMAPSAPNLDGGEGDPLVERAKLINLLASHGMLASVVQYGLLPAEVIRSSDWNLDADMRAAGGNPGVGPVDQAGLDLIAALAALLPNKDRPLGKGQTGRGPG